MNPKDHKRYIVQKNSRVLKSAGIKSWITPNMDGTTRAQVRVSRKEK